MGDRDDQGGKDNQDITEELDAYYQESNSGNGSTILYGLFALVVTLIVAAGLYFGGRAVYRALTGTGDNGETAQQEDQGTGSDTDNAQGEGGTGQAENGQNQTPGISPDTTDDETQTDDDSSEIPSTGDNLPRTGSPTGI